MSAETTTRRIVRREDFTPTPYRVEDVALEFDLEPETTTVTSRIQLVRDPDQPVGPLTLDGEHLELLSIAIDGESLPESRYRVDDEKLVIAELPDQCLLELQVRVNPAANKSLYGLYLSSGNYCTQCEAMGFRRITYFLDRPDVMARYHVTIRGDEKTCPVLLSNGNRVSTRQLDDGRHEAVWEDPFPKPSYLFALVAGDLRKHQGSFTTRGGREVNLEIWVEPQNIDLCEHALASLQKSMKWDEEVFGLEYDLDIYMIVAVNDFNMGAMENKGLNIFNSKYVLASPQTATDDDYLGVEAVIAHEYFHNWTGNRVTCRDWFQLTLKEGLTVFRDQQFTADQTSAAVKRIDDVRNLRSRQFPEDAGPMAHPIRPESYISMDNFYTATVYDKGAEIIRMYYTRLGAEGFRRGMDLYFERHDGQAVTCDDFRSAMADANNVNLELLDRWYSQPGTPTLEACGEWLAESGSYALTLRQSYPSLSDEIPGAADRKPVPIPVAVGLLGVDGSELPLKLDGQDTSGGSRGDQVNGGHTRVLLLEEQQQTFTFSGLSEQPAPSLLRGFSAPVRLRMERSEAELAFLMAHDSDSFNRWDAAQSLSTQLLLRLAEAQAGDAPLEVPESLAQAFGSLLADNSLDGSIKSLLLSLPSEGVAGQEMEVLRPDPLHAARRNFLKSGLAERHYAALLDTYQKLADGSPYRNDPEAINNRRLKATVLSYLASVHRDETTKLVVRQFAESDNMTDSQAALAILVDLPGDARDKPLTQFYERWHSDPLVLDKWFALQAGSSRTDTLQRVQELTGHADFTLNNPNRVRSLLGPFVRNQVRFHQADGAGYRLLTDYVLRIDPDNPQLAARLVSSFNDYRRLDKNRQQQIRDHLRRIAEHDGLSKDVFEIVKRALSFS